jgi:methionine aminopeptidase
LFGRRSTVGRTDEQLAFMRAAGLLVAGDPRDGRCAVADGMTTGALDSLAESYIRDNGGVPSFPGGAGLPAYPLHVGQRGDRARHTGLSGAARW